jgi:hypothetical protein
MNLCIYYGHLKLEDFTTTQSDKIWGNQPHHYREIRAREFLTFPIDAADRQRFYRSFMLFGDRLEFMLEEIFPE